MGVTLAVVLASACSDDATDGPQNSSGSGPVAGASGSAGAAGASGGGTGGASSGGTASGSGGTTGGASMGGSAGSGMAGSAGSGGSGGGGGSVQGPVKPVMRDGKWALDMGEVTLEVDPAVGGRIVTFKLGAENLLTGPAVNPTYYGSTLWISPETTWMQAAHINAMPYTAQARSEERRVGKECLSVCRSRWSPYH